MRVGVLGGSGQVGCELVRLLTKAGAAVVSPTSREVDLSNDGQLESWIHRASPEVVVNSAAYTAVDKAEDDRDRAFAINADGVGVLGRLCSRAHVRLVHLSTDFVFSGIKEGSAYTEDDSPDPLNVYGASKLAGERALANRAAGVVILRLSWVFSARTRNFVTAILERARSLKTLEVVDDQFGGPTSARAAASAVVTMLQNYDRRTRELYHLAATPYVSRYAFAERIVQRAQLKGLLNDLPEVVPIASSRYPTKVHRPKNSCLDGACLRRDFGIGASDWQQELDVVLDEVAQLEQQRSRPLH